MTAKFGKFKINLTLEPGRGFEDDIAVVDAMCTAYEDISKALG